MAYSLAAEKRNEFRKQLDTIRSKRQVPAVLYGFGVENQALTVDSGQFDKVYAQAGENQIIDLSVGGEKNLSVLIREVQIDPVKRQPIHADFQAIDVSKPVVVDVPIHFTGEAPAVKATGGSLVKKTSRLEIKCLPKDLPKYIEVSVSTLETIEDFIRVKDIALPEGLKTLHDPNDVVATVVPPRLEIEVAPAVVPGAEGAAPAAPGAEGAAAPAGDAKSAPAAEGKKPEGKKPEGKKKE